MRRKNVKLILAFGLVFLLLFQAILFAQAPDEKEKRIEEKKRKELERERKAEIAEKVYFDYGAWIQTGFYAWDDPITDRSMRIYDLRTWSDFIYNNDHRIYIRLQTRYDDYSSSDSYGTRDYKYYSPRLDQGFYEVLLSNCINDIFDTKFPGSLKLRAGRQFLYVGQGLTYNQVNDGVKVSGDVKDISFKTFWSKTVHSQDNIDQSVFVSSYTERYFWGAQVTLDTVFDKHQPYFYFVSQKDQTGERPDNPNQEYDYDSQYFGIGSTGKFPFIDKLRYNFEFVYETGRSCAIGSSSIKEKIRAHAVLAGLEYYAGGDWDARFTADYMYGSGDKDRASPTNTSNMIGTDDEGFVYFGFIPTGYSLAPILSNLHIFRVGAAITPIKEKEYFESLKFRADVYYYTKDKRGGGIFDYTTNYSSNKIGWEVDFSVNWKIFSDLSFSLEYGMFFPGEAYADKAKRDYFSFSLTLSF